jgi:hypothetical protein
MVLVLPWQVTFTWWVSSKIRPVRLRQTGIITVAVAMEMLLFGMFWND